MAENLDQLTKTAADTARELREAQSQVAQMKTLMTRFNNVQKDITSALDGLKSPVLSSIAGFIMNNKALNQQLALKQKEIAQTEKALIAKQAELARTKQLNELHRQSIDSKLKEHNFAVKGLTRQKELQDAVKKQKEEVEKLTKASGGQSNVYLSRAQTELARVQKHLTRVANITGVSEQQLQGALDKRNSEILKLSEKAKTLTDAETRLENETTDLAEALVDKQQEAQEMAFSQTTQKLLGVSKALETIAKALGDLVTAIRKTQQTFGITATQATKLRFNNLAESIDSYISALLPGGRTGAPVSLEEIEGAQTAFQEQFGGVISSEAAGRLASQAKEMGVTTEQLAKARRIFMISSMGNLSTATSQQNKFIGEFTKKGLTAKDALNAIAANSELFARNGNRFAASFAKAAAEAKKIGVDLGKIDQVGDNIIGDFEGFLTKMSELGAMGFGFDSQRLAEVAESGDTGALMDELRSQLAAQGKDLSNLRRSEQLALSQAFGMNIQEFLALAKPETKGASQETTSGEQMVGAQTETNTLLGRILKWLETNFPNLTNRLEAIAPALKGIAIAIAGVAAGRTIFGGMKFMKNIGGAAEALKTMGTPGIPTPETKLPTPPTGPGAGAGIGQTSSMFDKMSPAKMLAGAAALVLVATALVITAKAVQEFMKVDFKAMIFAGVALTGLVMAVSAIGTIMMSGVGTVAILAGAAALVVIGGALYLVGAAITKAGPGLESLGKMIKTAFEGLATVITATGDALVKIFGTLKDTNPLVLYGVAGGTAALATALGALALVVAPFPETFFGGIISKIERINVTSEKLKESASAVRMMADSLMTLSTAVNGINAEKLEEITDALRPTLVQGAAQLATGAGNVLTSLATRVAGPEQPTTTMVTTGGMDVSRLEQKLDQVVRAITSMRVELDGNRVGRVVANSAASSQQVGVYSRSS